MLLKAINEILAIVVLEKIRLAALLTTTSRLALGYSSVKALNLLNLSSLTILAWVSDQSLRLKHLDLKECFMVLV